VIHINVNGQLRQFPSSLTISELLNALELSGKRVAVEKNGEIVPKSLHSATRADDGDALEIVVAVGGG